MVNPRNNFIILGLVLVLIGAAAYFIFIRQPVVEATRLGLDLEGGVTANLQGYKTDGSEVTQQEMDVAAGVIRQRGDSLGVTEPEIQLQGQDQLGFYEVLASAGGQPVPEDEIESTKEELQTELEGDPAYEEGESQILFEESPSPTESGTVVAGYVLPKEPGLTGEALSSATLARDQQGRREVQMELTSDGAEGFGDLSQEIVDNALAEGRPGRGQLAVILDEDVISAPVVEQAIYGGEGLVK